MESLVNSDFVDEMFPEKPLHPRDPAEKAVGRLRVEKHCKLTQHFYKIVWLPSTEEERRASWDQLLNKVKARRNFAEYSEKSTRAFFSLKAINKHYKQ